MFTISDLKLVGDACVRSAARRAERDGPLLQKQPLVFSIAVFSVVLVIVPAVVLRAVFLVVWAIVLVVAIVVRTLPAFRITLNHVAMMLFR